MRVAYRAYGLNCKIEVAEALSYENYSHHTVQALSITPV
jgi:hypothetical protein